MHACIYTHTHIPSSPFTPFQAANLTGRVVYANLSDFLCRHIGGDPFTGRRIMYGVVWGIAPAFCT
jgi:hypothetical protein